MQSQRKSGRDQTLPPRHSPFQRNQRMPIPFNPVNSLTLLFEKCVVSCLLSKGIAVC
uniref:Uncharacterized protein n=1 Tax=Anguilla anguilla TaxID=7936 RepID=A0A0E9QX13_ANGAN